MAESFESLARDTVRWQQRTDTLCASLTRIIANLDRAVQELRGLDHPNVPHVIELIYTARDSTSNAAYGSLGTFRGGAGELGQRLRV